MTVPPEDPSQHAGAVHPTSTTQLAPPAQLVGKTMDATAVDVALQPPTPPSLASLATSAAAIASGAHAPSWPQQRKEDEVRAHDVVPSADAPRCQLEDFTPFSKSHLWKLMMSFYDRQGVESWAQGIVPHFITSNTFIAKKYSNVLRAFMRDAVRPNAASPLDPSEPFYIIELGTGSGKFSFYFLKALAEAEAALDFPLDNLRYIMTDFTEQNFNFWKTHPALAPFVARGIVDFAIFDATKDTELQLFNSQQVIRPGSCKNPVGIIANYLFDTLYHDLFQVDDGFLKEGLISVGSKRAEEPDPLDPEIIKRLSNVYKYEPIDSNYYGDDKPHLNNILKWYHEFYDPQSSGATILVPVGALSAIERLSHLAVDNRLVILSGDKGNNNPDHFRGVSDPHIAVHGSFSVMVNYHAIGVYIASRGGFAVHSPQEEASLKVSLFVLPATAGTPATPMADLYGEGLDRVCEERSRLFPQLTQAFDDEIVTFGPNDFFVMQKALKEDTKAPSLKAVLALLKLSCWDPDTFYKFRDVLLDHSPTCAPKLKRDVRMGIPQIWRNYYALDKEKDIAFEIGRLFYGIHDYDSALAFYSLSTHEMGKHHVTSHNMGLCHYSKKQLALAASHFEEAYGLNPSYQKAATWLQRVRNELGATSNSEQIPVVPRSDNDGLSEDLLVQQIQLVMPDHEEETATRPSLSRLSLDENATPRLSMTDE